MAFKHAKGDAGLTTPATILCPKIQALLQIQNIKTQLKERVAKGLNFGIEGVEEVLDPSAAAFNDYVLLKSKYNDLMYMTFYPST